MTLEDIYTKVSEELNIPEEDVKNIYRSFWIFIKNTIKELPLKEDLSDEEFNKLRVNFNIPSVGKLGCSLDRYKRIKKYYRIKNGNYSKKGKTNI